MADEPENMSSPDARLHHILRHLVRRSFPKLLNRPVTISWGTPDALLYYAVEADRHSIDVHERLRGAPRLALEGGIVHELCHIEADINMGAYQRQLAWNRYAESRWARMREERATERRLIDLGYGTHLLALIRFAHRLGYRFSRENGLLYAEIHRAIRIRNARNHSEK
jgi:hypothetical protein